MQPKLVDGSLERAILGTFFYVPEEAERFLPLLEEEDFGETRHRKIFRWLKEFFSSGEQIEGPMVLFKFRDSEVSKEIPIQYILTIRDYESIPVHTLQRYINLLKEKTARRKILEVSKNVSDEVAKEEEISKILAKLEQSIYDIEKQTFDEKTEPISKVVFRLYENIERLKESNHFVTGVPSGFYHIDRLTTGFQPGELVIIGARPAMGKTAFATSIAINAAKEGYSIGFISLEMPKEQIALRLLSNISHIPIYSLRSGMVSDAELEILQTKAIELARLPIHVNDKAGMKITELRAYAKKMKRENDIDILFVDYLQLVSADKFLESKEREVSEVSRSLKALAIDLNIPIVALAQLNRTVEQRADKRPMLSDLRNSGQIEQDADLIMFLHRPGYYKKTPSPEEEKQAEVIIAKQRNGGLGTIELIFENRYAKFIEKSNPEAEIEAEEVPF